MKEFFLQLAYGIRSIPKKYQKIFQDLKQKGLVEKRGELYFFQEKCLVGNVDISRSGRAFLCAFGGKDKKDLVIDKLPKNIGQNDIVLCNVTRIKGRMRAKVMMLLEAQNNQILCYLEKIKGEIFAIPLKNPQNKPIKLNTSQKSLLALPKFCVLSIDLSTKKIHKVIGALQNPLIDEKISLGLFEREEEFGPQAITLANSFGQDVDIAMYPNRQDLTHLPFCTIDPDDAKDHDDAIYFDLENSHLYIAIADVSEYVSLDSALDIEAKNRGFSVYFPHKSYPMLPPNLSENICSLQEGKIRLAFVWRLRLHRRSAEVLDSHLFEAVIFNHQNISYTDVDDFIDGKKISMNAGVKKSISDFLPVAKKLRAKRIKKGYEFFNDEIKLNLNANGLLGRIDILEQGISHTIVEEAMLLANQQSAYLIAHHLGEKGIYRIHDRPQNGRIDELFFDLKSLGFSIPSSKDFHQCIEGIQKQAKKKNMQKQIDKMIIKAQSQASYSYNNIGHFGLGFEAYSHFTSPIRRYSDLILHRLLKQIISDSSNSDKKLNYLLENIQPACILLNDQERQISRIELDFKDRKYARWAYENIGIRFEAIITDENYPPIASGVDLMIGARLFVQEMDIEVAKFDKIWVEIIDVDIATPKIYVKVLEGFNV